MDVLYNPFLDGYVYLPKLDVLHHPNLEGFELLVSLLTWMFCTIQIWQCVIQMFMKMVESPLWCFKTIYIYNALQVYL